MKQKLSIALMSAILVSQPVWAEGSVEKTERDYGKNWLGLGIGAVVGGAMAGPPGVLLGMFTGYSTAEYAELDKDRNAMLSLNADLSSKLNQTQAEKVVAQQQYQHMQEKERMMQVSMNEQKNAGLELAQQFRAQALASLSKGVALHVQFRTGSAQLEQHFDRQLHDMAAMLAQFPELSIDLAGYADPRGDAQTNQQLSQQRIDAVAAVLESAGVEANRIRKRALGEGDSLSKERSLESFQFERRVRITLVLPNGQV